MATCPVCNNKISFWRLEPLSSYNVKLFITCSCGAYLRAKYWFMWDLLMIGILMGSGGLLIQFISNVAPASKIIFLALWLIFIFFVPNILLSFATFIERAKYPHRLHLHRTQLKYTLAGCVRSRSYSWKHFIRSRPHPALKAI